MSEQKTDGITVSNENASQVLLEELKKETEAEDTQKCNK